MFRFFEQANFAIIEGRYESARSILEPYILSNALAAFEYIQIDLSRSNITGEDDLRANALKQLLAAETLLESHEKDDSHILSFAKDTARINKTAVQPLVEGYTFPPTEGAVPALDDMTDAQLIRNFRLLAQVMHAEIYVIKATLQYYASSMLKAANNIRKGYNNFEGPYKTMHSETSNTNIASPHFIHPDLIDYVDFGMGCYWYLISIAPKSLQSVLGFLGFNNDKKLGLQLVKRSVLHCARTFAGALLVYSLHYVFISSGFKSNKRRLEKFTPIIELCLNRFSSSPAVFALVSQYHRKFGNLDLAIDYNLKSVNISKEKLGIIPNAFLSDLGQCYYVKMDFESCIQILEQGLSKPGVFDGKGFIAVYLLCAYNMAQQVEKKKELLATLQNHIDKKSRIDKYAIEKLKMLKYIEKNETEVSLNLFCTHFDTIYARDRMDELDDSSNDLLLPMFNLFNSRFPPSVLPGITVDGQLAHLFVYTTLARRLGKLTQEQIMDNFKRIIAFSQKIKYEHQWAAFANYELASMVYKANGNKQSVMALLQAAADTKSFAMEEVFMTRIKTSMEQCGKLKQ
ncbi:tetratricopeptide repeat protein [Acrasis kona]|uniref:Tetratricopeptide repeat protein n=1 Tax=Acrasis kona TaxID=1008807 RepID=A0AAW2Z3T9_9EUKA